MTFNTGKPVPSTDPRDLYDNAENLDKLVNGVDPFYADRLGKLRESWAGMENSFTNAQEGRETAFELSQPDKESRFQAFLVSSGYASKGDYAAGVVLAERNEYVAVDAATTGTTAGLYRPNAAATLPLTLTGTWATDSANLVLLGDDALRQELAEDSGAGNIGFSKSVVYPSGTVGDRLRRSVGVITTIAELSAMEGEAGLVTLSAGGRSGLFRFSSENLSDLVSADPLQGLYVAPDSDPTGASGAWVRQEGAPVISGSGLRIGWFGAVGDGVTDDSAAIQAAYDLAAATRIGRVEFGYGRFAMASTVMLDKGSCTFVGYESGFRQSGSVTTGSYLLWIGGAAPMFAQSTTGMRFKGFSVGNAGAATDWLELNSGAQSNDYDDLYFFVHSDGSPFSRSVIRSNGNRLGYSEWSRIRANSPAPSFIDLDGQGTPNGITPLAFKNRCMFFASGNDFTVLKVVDENIEVVSFTDCTLVGQATAALTVVDTTGTPAGLAINVLRVKSCEMEQNGSNASARLFRLTNIPNFSFDDNDTTGSDVGDQFVGDLANTNLTSCEGNRYRRFDGGLFSLDSSSRFSVGLNGRDASNTGPVVVGGQGVIQIPYAASMVVDGMSGCPSSHQVFRIDVNNNSGYQVRAGASRPNFILSGQVFTVEIRNVTTGAIAAPSFTTNFKVGAGLTAPAAGNSRSVTFYFDGTNAREISRSIADLPIA